MTKVETSMRLALFGGGLVVWALSACGGVPEGEARSVQEGTQGNGVEESAPYVRASTPEEAGRYLVIAGGCNDCHTEGYGVVEVTEEAWLTGSSMGIRGPWGTSYASNLRLTVERMTEDQWVEMLRTRKGLPPMPWINVAQLAEPDLRALYRYLAKLGPRGTASPAPLPPGVEPKTPWVDFTPRNLPGGAEG